MIMGRLCVRRTGVYVGVSVPSAQFPCEPETAVKKKKIQFGPNMMPYRPRKSSCLCLRVPHLVRVWGCVCHAHPQGRVCLLCRGPIVHHRSFIQWLLLMTSQQHLSGHRGGEEDPAGLLGVPQGTGCSLGPRGKGTPGGRKLMGPRSWAPMCAPC